MPAMMARNLKQNGHTVYDPQSNTAFQDEARIPVSHADEGEFLTLVSARFGLTLDETAELLDMSEEHLAGRVMTAPGAPDGMRVVRRGYRHIICARTYRQQSFLLRILGWTLGLSKEIDGDVTLTEIGSKFGLSKADASKFACMFRDSLGTASEPLPVMPGQRDEKARTKFAKKRIEQEGKRRVKATDEHGFSQKVTEVTFGK